MAVRVSILVMTVLAITMLAVSAAGKGGPSKESHKPEHSKRVERDDGRLNVDFGNHEGRFEGREKVRRRPGHPHGGPPGHSMGRGKGHQKHSGGNPDHPHGGPPGHRKDSEAAARSVPAIDTAIESVIETLRGERRRTRRP